MTTERDDIERRIADSLRNRAGDVTPSPELWTRVESTVNANTRRTWLLAAAGVTAAVAAVVIVPQLFESTDGPIVGPGPSESPTVAPTEPEPPVDGTEVPTGPISASDDAILATDGEDVFLMDLEGERLATYYEGNREDEDGVGRVVVRPGGTRTDFDAVVVFGGEGGVSLSHLAVNGGSNTLTPFPDHLQPATWFLAEAPVPAFSPDGHHLAWVEMPDDEQAEGPTLRTIGWDDGPGTGRPADDNASFALTELPLEHYRVEDWVWERQDVETPGHLVLRATRMIETVLVPIARQGDGALILPIGGTTLVDGAIVDRAETTIDGVSVIYSLEVASDGSEDAEGVTWTVERDRAGQVATTEVTLGETADPGLGWMDAVGERVLAGHGSTMLLVEDGEVVHVFSNGDFAFWSAALIPPDLDAMFVLPAG